MKLNALKQLIQSHMLIAKNPIVAFLSYDLDAFPPKYLKTDTRISFVNICAPLNCNARKPISHGRTVEISRQLRTRSQT